MKALPGAASFRLGPVDGELQQTLSSPPAFFDAREALVDRLRHEVEHVGPRGQRRVLVSVGDIDKRDLPPTNNGSERALRPAVTFRKVTNGFRTDWGAKLYADIRSVIETARRRSLGALDAIRLTLDGTPLPLAP